MNRIFSVVRSMTEKIVELSRGVVTSAAMGKVSAESGSIRSMLRRHEPPTLRIAVRGPAAEAHRL